MLAHRSRIKWVDWHDLENEVEKRLGYDWRSFRDFYKDKPEEMEKLWTKFRKDYSRKHHLDRGLSEKHPLVKSFDMEDALIIQEESIVDAFKETLEGRLYHGIRKHGMEAYLDFWHLTLDLLGDSFTSFDGYNCFNISKAYSVAIWAHPILDVMVEVLEEEKLCFLDYYEQKRFHFKVDW